MNLKGALTSKKNYKGLSKIDYDDLNYKKSLFLKYLQYLNKGFFKNALMSIFLLWNCVTHIIVLLI